MQLGKLKVANLLVIAAGGVTLTLLAADKKSGSPPPTADQVLALRPSQRFVDCDSPTSDQLAGCKVEAVKEGKATGWVIRDAAGRIYRRFMDTNGDNSVDLWVYYQNGVEIYRDIDSNFNQRADQFRWMNSGGTKWAVDANEDGAIDGYRIISVEEATREVVRAIGLRDFSLIQPLLVRANEATLAGGVISAEQVKDLNGSAKQQFNDLAAKLSHVTIDSRWMRFDGGIPQLVIGDAADGSHDVSFYRDATAFVQSGGQADLLQFPLLVQIGRAWKIAAMPSAIAADPNVIAKSGSDLLFNVPPTQGPGGNDAGIGDELQALITQLQKLDESVAKSPAAANAPKYHLDRAAIIEKIADQSKAVAERLDWQRQAADSLFAALQIEVSKETQNRIKALVDAAKSQEGGGAIASYVTYRQISADFSIALQAPNSDFAAVQKDWLAKLEKFVADYPDSEDAPDALYQLATGLETDGNEDAAREHYKELSERFPKSPAAQHAAGSIRRLDLNGKPLSLRGTDINRGKPIDIERLQGKVVFVDYWSTRCDPWKSELTQLKKIYDKYHSKGFEIVGVSLDDNKDELAKFIKKSDIAWPVIFEAGGLESPLAAQYGIIALPTHFLVDAKGNVINRTIQVSQLEEELGKLLK